MYSNTYQSLHTGAGRERGAGLVEGNVTIRANTTEEQLNSTVLGDLSLVVGALGQEIGSVAVQNVNVLRTTDKPAEIMDLQNINVLEQVLVHEAVIALRVVGREVHVLVHVEGNHVLEGNASSLVGIHKLSVHTNGRGSSGQTYL